MATRNTIQDLEEIIVTPKDGGFLLSGGTYPYSHAIRKEGGVWVTGSGFFVNRMNQALLTIVEMSKAVSGKARQLALTKPAQQAEPIAKPTPALPAPAEPPKSAFVKPSYWDDLMTYLRPNHTRPAIVIVGPAGNGKTSTAEAVLSALKIEYLVIDANDTLEASDLIGSMTYATKNGSGGEVWRDGIVTRAFKQGKAIIINEFDALNPRAALCLQSALQDAGADKKGRYVTTPGAVDHDRVYPIGDCPIILTMNTWGTGATREYVGRNALDAASLDRLTVISTVYENEDAILRGRGYGADTAKKLVRWAVDMRRKIEANGVKVILSNRTLIRMAQAIEDYGWSFDKAVDKEFVGRLEPRVAEMLK